MIRPGTRPVGAGPVVASLAAAGLVLVGCGGGGPEPEPSAQVETVVDAAVGTRTVRSEQSGSAPQRHWVIDEDADGVYVCLLRRGDDLAALRAGF